MNDSRLAAVVEEAVERLCRALEDRPGRPDATYRVQFDPRHFNFRGAAEIVPYLKELGISHVYASPYLKVRAGSPHGYAIVDYTSLNPELGTPNDYESFLAALREHGLEQILDVVPNHMGAAPGENRWWDDVLENGPGSPYADFFDIGWRPVKEELRNKILLPVLGRQFGQALEAGELRLGYGDGAFFFDYFGTRLPLDPRTYAEVLASALGELRESLFSGADDLRELESILTALDYLPDRNETDPDRVEERQREKEVIKARLRRLVAGSPAVGEAVDRGVRQFNGTLGDPASFDRLEELLDGQVYRLSSWKAAADEINYRRFFDVNDLAAICVEESQVFEATHRLVLDLLAEGKLAGLRIDHIDGLFDPLEYLWRLQWGYVRALGRREYVAEFARIQEPSVVPRNSCESSYDQPPPWEEIEPEFLESVWQRFGGRRPNRVLPEIRSASGESPAGDPPGDEPPEKLPLYVLVEKILGPEEPLPAEWPVAGTTGYDFLNSAGGLFVEPRGLAELVKIYGRYTHEKTRFDNTAYRAKLLILRSSMSSELQLLAYRLNRISERHRLSRDLTLNTLRTALREVLACFPVYRTYIGPEGCSERDRHVLNRAVAQAKRRNPAVDAEVFDFLRGVLLLEQPPELDEVGKRERQYFVGRFQQVTSPVMAKGIEDTAFYRYCPLVSLNEVGGEPDRAVVSVEEFHEENLALQQHRSGSLLCTSTHDTKRSEDVRARISVLAEIPFIWRSTLNRWTRLNRPYHREVDGQTAPSRTDEYLFYQSLLGIWPLEPPDEEVHRRLVDRVLQYMKKATHEAKLRTSWISPNPVYDEAVRDFVNSALARRPKNRFLEEFAAFCERIVNWGLYTALSQTFLKLASPGVPDVYQGQELWDFSLVDPDNRRPVDYGLRRELLRALANRMAEGDDALLATARQLGASPRDPRLKLFVTWQMLQFRRQHGRLFRQGRYVPLAVEGSRAKHVCALAWQLDAAEERRGRTVIAIAPRLVARLTLPSETSETPSPPIGPAVWEDTQVVAPHDTEWPLRNVFTGQQYALGHPRLPLAAMLSDFPVALLTSEH